MEILNYHYFNRYCKFLSSRPKRKYIPNSGLEKHHIKPKSIFPELKRDKTNIIVLTCREHYLAHWMLAKIYGGKMWFAFNQMSRIYQGFYIKNNKSSKLYSQAKKYISSVISESGKGRKASAETKKKLSDATKGCVVVRQANAAHGAPGFRIKVDDERLKNNEVVMVHKDRKNSDQSIENLIKNNGIRGKSAWYNNETGVLAYFSDDEYKDTAFSKGNSKEFRDNVKNRFTDIVTYYDPEENRHYRISVDIVPKPNWIKGRRTGFDAGLSKMNDPNIKNVFDLSSKSRKLVQVGEMKDYYILTPSNGYIIIWRNYLITSETLFHEIMGTGRLKFDKKFKHHHNQSERMKYLSMLFSGKSYNDMGVKRIMVNDISSMVFDYTSYELITEENYELKRHGFRRTFEKENRA